MFRLDVRSLASYPAAVAAVLACAAVISLKIYQATGDRSASLSRVRRRYRRRRMLKANGRLHLRWPRGFSGRSRFAVLIKAPRLTRSSRDPPRYVLDSVPVSYESTFRF